MRPRPRGGTAPRARHCGRVFSGAGRARRPRGRRLWPHSRHGSDGIRLPINHMYWRSDMMPSHVVLWHFATPPPHTLEAQARFLGYAYSLHARVEIDSQMCRFSLFAAIVFAESWCAGIAATALALGPGRAAARQRPSQKHLALRLRRSLAPARCSLWGGIAPTGPVAQWVGDRPAGLGAAGPSPAGVIFIWPLPCPHAAAAEDFCAQPGMGRQPPAR